MHKVNWGPLIGPVSAEKALQGSEMETSELLGGTEEKGCLLEVHIFNFESLG